MKKLVLVLLAGSFAAVNAVPFCSENTPFEDGQYYQFKMNKGSTCSLASLSAKISHCRVPGEDVLYATRNNTLTVDGQNVTALEKGKTEGVCFESPNGERPHFWRMTVN